jgi:hypothetical protein
MHIILALYCAYDRFKRNIGISEASDVVTTSTFRLARWEGANGSSNRLYDTRAMLRAGANQDPLPQVETTEALRSSLAVRIKMSANGIPDLPVDEVVLDNFA